MNRRNLNHANAGCNRPTGKVSRASWFPEFEPTARDLGLHVRLNDGSEELLPDRTDSEDKQP